jgi:hypothetical protein
MAKTSSRSGRPEGALFEIRRTKFEERNSKPRINDEGRNSNDETKSILQRADHQRQATGRMLKIQA